MADLLNTGFWAEGPERLRHALSSRRSQLDALVQRLRDASSADERQAVAAEIRELVTEYQPSQDELSHCLHLLK